MIELNVLPIEPSEEDDFNGINPERMIDIFNTIPTINDIELEYAMYSLLNTLSAGKGVCRPLLQRIVTAIYYKDLGYEWPPRRVVSDTPDLVSSDNEESAGAEDAIDSRSNYGCKRSDAETVLKLRKVAEAARMLGHIPPEIFPLISSLGENFCHMVNDEGIIAFLESMADILEKHAKPD